MSSVYGRKCHLCAHLTGSTHHVEARWPVADDECQDCSFCQEAAFIGAYLRTNGGDDLFDLETRAAVKALMAGKPHPILDKLRAEVLGIDGCGGQTETPGNSHEFDGDGPGSMEP